MQIGSVVEMIKPLPEELIKCLEYFNHDYPKPGFYLVRDLSPDKVQGIYVEDIYNPLHPFSIGLIEPFWHREYFREVSKPLDLSKLFVPSMTLTK
jgi:hypothetical protein